MPTACLPAEYNDAMTSELRQRYADTVRAGTELSVRGLAAGTAPRPENLLKPVLERYANPPLSQGDEQAMPRSELLAYLKWMNIGDDEIRLSTSFLRNYAPEAGESFELGLRFMF